MVAITIRAGAAALTTPDKLRRALAATLALALLTALLALHAAGAISDAARTIGRDAEPSVALGLRMQAALGELDAAALADALEGNGVATGTSRSFREARGALLADIIDAARNITYGEAQAAPLRALQASLPFYEEALAEARASGSNAWLIARRMAWASRVNRLMAVPQAEALVAANAGPLEQRYANYRAGPVADGVFACMGFVGLIGALIWSQVWLARRVRRTVNVPLAAATLIAVLTALWFGSAVIGEREAIRTAKADAYDSLSVLYQAKAAASAIRADFARWLQDPSTRVESAASITADERALIAPDTALGTQRDSTLNALDRALRDEESGDTAQARAATPHLDGFLGKELENITFGPPERHAASDSVAALATAEQTVAHIAGEEREGRHATAVYLWTTAGPDGATIVFDRLRDALDRTIAVNQGAFDTNIEYALRVAGRMPWATSIGLGLAAVCAVAGVWQRLREYR
jgi:hypothetical protein